MGTFERIRKISGWAFAVFVVVFVGFMVLSDADIQSIMQKGQTAQTAVIADINGEEILFKDYEAKVNQRIEQMRANQKNPDEEIDYQTVRSQVWEEMVEEILLKQEASKVGIVVTDEEILDVMLDNPPDYFRRPFTDSTGKFNKRLYLELVTDPEKVVNYLGADPTKIPAEDKAKAVADFRNQLIEISKYLRQQKLAEGLVSAVGTSGSIISPNFAKTKFKSDNSSADISYIHFSINDIKADQIKVNDDEIKKYYDEHKQYYTQKPQRKIKFVSIPLIPSADDSIRTNKKIDNILRELQKGTYSEMTDSIFTVKLNEYSGTENDWKLLQDIEPFKAAYFTNAPDRQVIGPVRLPDGTYFFRVDGRRTGEQEVAKASHILISANNNKDSAKAEAEKIMKRAKSGEDFAQLASELSQDKGSAAQGGDVGFFSKGKMVKPFEDAVFAASVGSVVGPVETQFGYHIIKVTDKKSEELKYSEIKLVPQISQATRNKIRMDANSISTQVEAGTPFETVVKNLKLNPVETPFFDKNRPVMNSRALTNDIFDANVGDVLKPREMKNYGYIIAQVVDERKAGIAELKDVKEEITAKIKKVKQLDMIKSRAEAAYNQVKTTGLATATGFDVKTAQVKDNGVVPGLGQDFALTATVFKSNQGQLVGPVRGELGYYIIQVNTKAVPDENTVSAAVKDYKVQLQNQARQAAFYQWFQFVKERAKIEDNRGQHYDEF